MRIAMDVAQVLLALLLIGLVLLQGKGSSASAFFNREAATTYRTRRGIERTLLQATIIIAVIFSILSLINNLSPRLFGV
ncbi:MAG TPA: preprotein translocase subunit SecG [Herpetosiphonaceae bacterium]|nr:preprotein translocase subunit SecG [Herpetosiphonaceae bacterium]